MPSRTTTDLLIATPTIEYLSVPSRPNDPLVRVLGFGEREYQIQSFLDLIDSTRVKLDQPTATGKTTVVSSVMAYRQWKHNHRRRTIIVAPDSGTIVEFTGQVKGDAVLPITYDLSPAGLSPAPPQLTVQFEGTNFADGMGDVTERAITWLRQDIGTLRKDKPEVEVSGTVGAMTYAAFLMVFGEMVNRYGEGYALSRFENCDLFFDEGNRLMGILSGDVSPEEFDSQEDVTEANRTGAIVRNICKLTSSYVAIITATMYRTSGEIVKTIGDVSEWKTSKVPFSALMKVLKKYGTLSIGMYTSTHDSVEDMVHGALGAALKSIKGGRRILWTLPPENTAWRRGNEHLIKWLKDEAAKALGDAFVDVEGKDQERKKLGMRRISQEPKDASGVPTISLVLAQKMVRVGTNWCPCDTVYYMSQENAPWLMVQTLGRALRPFGGKETIEFYTFIDEPRDAEDAERMTTIIHNQHVCACVLGSSVLDSGIEYARISGSSTAVKPPVVDVQQSPPANAEPTKTYNPPRDIARDWSAACKVLGDGTAANVQCRLIRANQDWCPSGKFDSEQARQRIEDILDDMGVWEARQTCVDAFMGIAQAYIPSPRPDVDKDDRGWKPVLGSTKPASRINAPSEPSPNMGEIALELGFKYTGLHGDSVYLGSFGMPQWEHMEKLSPEIQRAAEFIHAFNNFHEK